MPGIWETLFGSGDKLSQVPTKTTGQQNLMNQLISSLQGGGIFGNNQLYQSGSNYLGDLYSQSPDAFKRLADPYMRQFQQQTVPGLAERFSGAGYGGRQSSAFNQAMGQAGQNLSSQLAGMFEQLRSQNLGNLMNFSNMPYNQAMGAIGQNMFENVYQPGSTGLIGGALQGLGGGLGMGMGLPAGSSLINALMRLFQGNGM